MRVFSDKLVLQCFTRVCGRLGKRGTVRVEEVALNTTLSFHWKWKVVQVCSKRDSTIGSVGILLQCSIFDACLSPSNASAKQDDVPPLSLYVFLSATRVFQSGWVVICTLWIYYLLFAIRSIDKCYRNSFN